MVAVLTWWICMRKIFSSVLYLVYVGTAMRIGLKSTRLVKMGLLVQRTYCKQWKLSLEFKAFVSACQQVKKIDVLLYEDILVLPLSFLKRFFLKRIRKVPLMLVVQYIRICQIMTCSLFIVQLQHCDTNLYVVFVLLIWFQE